jgi:hypothetical protein
MNRILLFDVFLAAAFGCQACGDHETDSHWADHFRWREIEIPQFRDTKYIRDTKVYRLRKDHEFVFVLSVGKYLNRDCPRTAYIGHVDADDTVTLTNLKELTEKNTNDLVFPDLFAADMADPHVHVTNYDSGHLWVSWTCGLDTDVCAIRSEDGGRNFNDDTFSVARATGLFDSTHEPSMTCSSETDCLLTWGEKLSNSIFDTYSRRFTENGWCPPGEKQKIGDRLGIPLEMSAALGSSTYLVSAIDPAWLCFNRTRLRSANLTFNNEACHAEVDPLPAIDCESAASANACAGFHYDGAAGNIAPRSSISSFPTWQV